jgi:hypothetical protein
MLSLLDQSAYRLQSPGGNRRRSRLLALQCIAKLDFPSNLSSNATIPSGYLPQLVIRKAYPV